MKKMVVVHGEGAELLSLRYMDVGTTDLRVTKREEINPAKESRGP